MSPFAVLVPVKAGGAKSRLAGVLDEDERHEFSRVLLQDLLTLLAKSGLVEVTYVVSSDTGVLSVAEELGASGIREPRDSGVNDAVNAGLEAVRARSVVVLPSDLPLLQAPDLERLQLLHASGLQVVIAPSIGFNGTNALVFQLNSRIPLSYDSDSFWNHLKGAAGRGLSTAVCCARGLMFDVDTEDDFAALSRETLNRRSVEYARRKVRWATS